MKHPRWLLPGAFASFVGWYAGRYFRDRARSSWRPFAGRVLLAAASLVVSLVAMELGIRVFFDWSLSGNTIEKLREYQEGKDVAFRSAHPLARIVHLSSDPDLVYELRPNLDVDFGHTRVRTNADGMRESRDYAIERPPRSVRVVGIGDSGMFGWGVEQDEDYMAVLEKRLGDRGDGVTYEVLNLGTPGYNTHLEVEALRVKGLKYRPDVVVVGWCDNDFQLPFFMAQKGNFWRTDASYVWTLLFDRPNLVHLLEGGIRDLRSFERDRVSEALVRGSDVAGVTDALERLKGMAAEHGFRILLFGPVGRGSREVLARTGVDVFNTFEKIPKGRYPREFAVHAMHPRKEGHAALAEALDGALVERSWLASR